jgi:hypothetical protein
LISFEGGLGTKPLVLLALRLIPSGPDLKARIDQSLDDDFRGRLRIVVAVEKIDEHLLRG